MTCAGWEDRLDAWLQGRLSPAEREDVEVHLRGCEACRETFAAAEAMQREARRIAGPGPTAATWAVIAARLEPALAKAAAVAPPPQTVRPTLRWRGLAIAALLTLVVGGSLWALRQSLFAPEPSPPATAADAEVPAPGDLVTSIEQELDQAAQHYERAIAGLEQVATESDSPIDPAVTATLRENLRIIDAAIDDSRVALRAEPTSQVAQESLFDAFRRKVTLLQDTIALMNEMRKGNQAEAASIATGLSKG